MKKKVYLVGMLLSLLVFCFSIFSIVNHRVQASKATEEFNELVEMFEEKEESAEEKTEEQEVISPLERYLELCRQNNDLAGWIMIEDTNINYPVMYTPAEKDFYLKHNFDKESSIYGVPYIAEHCSPSEPSDNIIIYGHHMNDGSMFADLMKYESKQFYEAHKTIRFDTITEVAEYEIVSVFKTTVYDEDGFKFYLFSNAKSDKEFDGYIKSCKSLELYDTGVSAVYGDKLITISTCEYSKKNGRMVVVAKKITK